MDTPRIRAIRPSQASNPSQQATILKATDVQQHASIGQISPTLIHVATKDQRYIVQFSKLPILDSAMLNQLNVEGAPTRKDAWIPSQGGTSEISAWYYPSPAGKRGPAVVIGHGIGGTKSMCLDNFAALFQQAGYAAFAFDYSGFGASRGIFPRQRLDFYAQQRDWDDVLSYVRKHELVDPEQVALFGSSFGGGHVIEVAARDTRVAAVISQCPFTSGRSSAFTLGVLPTLKIVPLAIYDLVQSLFSNYVVPVQLAGRPGEVALMNSAGAYEAAEKILPVNGVEPERWVGARFALQIIFLEPGAKAKKVKCPLHVAVCMADTVAPPRATLAYVRQAPKGDIKQYDIGHFEPYLGDGFDMVTPGYVEFLHTHLPPVTR